MERILSQGITKIEYAEYVQLANEIKHIFLVGDLQQPCAHPFIRDDRFEMIICSYKADDNGSYHWHTSVNEYEWVLEGEIGYYEVVTGQLQWLLAGDFLVIPSGLCVQRRVRQPTRTITIKVPSANDKIYCAQCSRTCSSRTERISQGIF